MSQLELNLIDISYYTIICGSFICSLMMIKRGSNWAFNGRILGLAMLFISIHALMTFFLASGALINFPWLFRLFFPLNFLIAPLLFFFIRHTLKGSVINFNKDWLHFIPAVIAFCLLIPHYIKSVDEKRLIVELIFANPELSYELGGGFIKSFYLFAGYHILFLVYTIFAIRLIVNKFKLVRKLRLQKNIQDLLLVIVIFMTIISITLITADANYLLSDQSSGFKFHRGHSKWMILELIIYLSLLLFNIYSCFLPNNELVNNLSLFIPDEVNRIRSHSKIEESPQYREKAQRNGNGEKLTLEEESILARLIQGMETEEWYKNKNFTSDDYVRLLGIRRHQLSSIFRKNHNKRFSSFVNEYRIAFIKDEIKKGRLKTHTLEALSIEAGFNSRTSFYKAFLILEGVNPRAYFADFDVFDVEK